MFDPSSLKARYEALTGWKGGKWVNYWTQTVPKTKLEGKAGGDLGDTSDPRRLSAEWMDNDGALVVNGIVNPEGKGDSPSSELTLACLLIYHCNLVKLNRRKIQ
jgi:hypothetical protein